MNFDFGKKKKKNVPASEQDDKREVATTITTQTFSCEIKLSSNERVYEMMYERLVTEQKSLETTTTNYQAIQIRSTIPLLETQLVKMNSLVDTASDVISPDVGDGWVEYPYSELLDNIYNRLDVENTNNHTIQKKTLQAPIVGMEGRKTVWANFTDTCIALRRECEQLLKFVQDECQTSCSVTQRGELLMKGRFKQANIQTLLKKFIREFVKCPSCSSSQTRIKKEGRLTFICCEKCQTKKSLKVEKNGFISRQSAGHPKE